MLAKIGFGAAGLAAIAALVFAFLWKSEQSDHEYTKRFLDAETRRANVATEIANENAAKIVLMEKNEAVRSERQKIRAIADANIMQEKNAELLKIRQRIGAFRDAIEKRPKVAERTMRADINRGLRARATGTCRADCEN